jgi:cytochrome c biogenesis protein CcdA
MTFKKALVFLLVSGCFVLGAVAQAKTPSVPVLTVFVSATCYDCIQTKAEVMPGIEKAYKSRLKIEYREIEDQTNYKLLLGLEEKYHAKLYQTFPVFFLDGNFLGPDDKIKENLRPFIDKALLNYKAPVQEESVPQVDILKRFEKLTPLAIISVGLLDGFNPCAITVIVFFMSFLAMQGYRRREIVLIGLIFIFSVYLTYVLIGVGTLEFIYRIQGFYTIAKVVNVSVGIFSIVTGFMALYDYIKFKKDKNTSGLLLQLPKSMTNRIHKVIREEYKAGDAAAEAVHRKKTLAKLAIGALITGFLVSAFEAVCVVKIYLPTIIFMLKTTGHRIQALGYLLLYNLLFVIPLLGIFVCALAGTTSEQFAAWLKRHMGLLKILLAVMFFGLGLFLIFRA